MTYSYIDHLYFRLIRSMPLDSVDDATRMVEWYERPGQSVTDWDTTRYKWAKVLVALKPLYSEDAVRLDHREASVPITEREFTRS